MIEIINETNEIILSGIVGDGWDDQPITAKEVGKALKVFGSNAITVRINSPGGAADEGIAIYNLLKNHSGEVTTVNDSLAASAASVIFLGGSKRLMGDGSRLMIHRAMGLAFGNQDQIKKMLAALESYDRSLVEIYSQYMPTEPDAIEALMAKETWFESELAIESGLATGRYSIDKKKKTQAQFDQAKSNLLRAKMAAFAKRLDSEK
jgi:ATP-dependent protease ClpP protease subunit